MRAVEKNTMSAATMPSHHQMSPFKQGTEISTYLGEQCCAITWLQGHGYCLTVFALQMRPFRITFRSL